MKSGKPKKNNVKVLKVIGGIEIRSPYDYPNLDKYIRVEFPMDYDGTSDLLQAWIFAATMEAVHKERHKELVDKLYAELCRRHDKGLVR